MRADRHVRAKTQLVNVQSPAPHHCWSPSTTRSAFTLRATLPRHLAESSCSHGGCHRCGTAHGRTCRLRRVSGGRTRPASREPARTIVFRRRHRASFHALLRGPQCIKYETCRYCQSVATATGRGSEAPRFRRSRATSQAAEPEGVDWLRAKILSTEPTAANRRRVRRQSLQTNFRHSNSARGAPTSEVGSSKAGSTDGKIEGEHDGEAQLRAIQEGIRNFLIGGSLDCC